MGTWAEFRATVEEFVGRRRSQRSVSSSLQGGRREHALLRSLLALALLLGVVVVAQSRFASTQAAAMNPKDETLVPHYFGPYPNWANSPQVLSNAVVKFNNGGGSGAAATASVNPKTGGIDSITVTSPGSGFTTQPDVVIESPGVFPTTPAVATAEISAGVIKTVAVVESGFGFVAPMVTLTGGNPTIGLEATAVASGSVDNVTLTSGGTGYLVKPIVEFSLPNLPNGVRATGSATMNSIGIVDGITVENAGSGYTSAPTVTILDGGSPVVLPAVEATAVATINVNQVDVVSGGQGYDSAPTVTIADTVGVADKGATATATVAVKGAVTAVNVTTAGAGYLTPGIKKFVDTLAGLGPDAANNLGQYIPVAVPDTSTYPGSDYYEIAVVQYRQKFSSQLPATLLRGYVQLSTGVVPGKQVPLSNVNLDPNVAPTPISGYTGVDGPHYLGPTIVATKDKPVRILFRNLLPTGVGGDLFLPVDTSLMGAGAGPDMMSLDKNNVPIDMAPDQGLVTDGVRNPMCGETPKDRACYSENRATLHLHGGITPWISDGTPHQWTTPAGQDTAYPKGVSVSNVPDMPDPGPGAETFFYTNQQSARLMFYHDHAWGITRLNVYAGEAAGYVITDDIEKKLLAPATSTAPAGALAGLGLGTPLVIQDKTFVPDVATMAKQDPTWNYAKWGGAGNLWSPHVYMPAQNPGDPSGMSAFGRWMYGPWFWPPAKDAKYPPIANPYYDAGCDPNVVLADGSNQFCEPALIPSTPNVSVGMEAFNDTPVVNGTAYPTTTVDPKAYRYRILNAANDRFWNLSWYVADPTTGTLSEVALKPADVAAAQTDPNVVPTPDTTKSPAGPDWIQIGSEGGFLPAPVVVPAHPTTWITDPTRFDVGNVDQHSLLLAPAERADVVVDFSLYRGKTLILYNDAPAAFPARVAGYDYYTGGPDLTPAGAPTTLPGYGPNTRTIMQVKVSSAAPAIAFDRPYTTNDRLGALLTAFGHHTDGTGVFESGQNPILVGQAAYNSAYGKSFVTNGWCNSKTNPAAKCDGYARIAEQGGDLFKFDTLNGAQLAIPLQPKGIHDEMNSANFDEWGRMTANMGLEAAGATPLLQNIVLYPYVNPAWDNKLDSTGLPSSLNVTPISSATDGTQIWKITHNGVDTHPIHFHLYDVQVINRVTWDNIIIPPEPTELGWKDTVRISPLEDTIVAVRPIVPVLPFGLPDSKRPLNPMMPLGAQGSANGPNGTEAGFNNTLPNGNPTLTPIKNTIENFGAEYVVHCHILSHEEMDMMRPVTVTVAHALADAPVLSRTIDPGGAVQLMWTDGTPVNYADMSTWGSPAGEVGFRIERADVTGGVAGAYTAIATAPANSTSYSDSPPPLADPTAMYSYRVIAFNAAGDATSGTVNVGGLPEGPVGLAAAVQAAPTLPMGTQISLTWSNTSSFAATSLVVERAMGAGAFGAIASLGAAATSFVDSTVVPGKYSYRVNALSVTGPSAYAGPVAVTVQPVVTTMLLVSSSASSTSNVGDNVKFTATVAAVGATAIPSGKVTFTANGATVEMPLAGGVAAFSTTALPAGANKVTASFLDPAAAFQPVSADLTQTVTKRATTTVLVNSPNPSYLGQSVTFTATVRPVAGAGVPTGRVLFSGTGAVASVMLDAAGVASFTTNITAPIGTNTITADYSGDAAFVASTTSVVQTTIAKLATTTVLASNRVPSATFGQNVTFAATVRPISGATIPTGSVVFTVDGFATAPVVLNGQGRASYTLVGPSAGNHTVVAEYSGSLVLGPSTSAPYIQVVKQAPSTTTVTSSRNPSVYGQNVTFTVRVTPAAATGFVLLNIDGGAFAASALDATGRATFVVSTLSGGASHIITANYDGLLNYLPSSGSLTQTVKWPTATGLTSSQPTALAGTAVTFTATVAPVAPGTGVPTGTVQFRVDGNNLGAPVTLDASGNASITTSTIAIGRHTMTAIYSGDALFSNSTSPNLTQRIQ